MQPNQTIKKLEEGLKSSLDHFEQEMKKLRTGRAHPGMLDGIVIEAYGTEMPLIQVGTITAPEPQLLQITPFDPNNLEAISAAIRKNQSLDMNPMDDGKVVRDIVKILNSKVEDTMISMRNVRHDAMKELDEAKKNKEIGDDEHNRFTKQVDEKMAEFKTKVESAAKIKEAEILKI